MKGIYCYIDNEKDTIVYIGKDSHIDKHLRHLNHKAPSRYNNQVINRIIQNNPERYDYKEIYLSNDVSEDILNTLEKRFIKRYSPKFNFTKGGDGTLGYSRIISEETKKKLSEAHKGKTLSEEHKRKIGESGKGRKVSEEYKQRMSECQKGEKNFNWKPYARIIKRGFKNNKQVYAIRFEGKQLKQSINLDKLVEWFHMKYPTEKLENNIT